MKHISEIKMNLNSIMTYPSFESFCHRWFNMDYSAIVCYGIL